MLDLRELAEELDELRDRRDEAAHTCKCGATFDPDDGPTWHKGTNFVDVDEDAAIRLRELEALEDELDDLHLASRRKGPFVADGHEWVEYCEQLAADLGYVGKDNPMSSYIDWDKWADAVQQDYTPIEFDGETYWYRG